LKVLAVVTPSRLTPAPEITPIADVYPGCDPGVWQSIGAPAGTSREVMEVKLIAHFREKITLRSNCRATCCRL